MWDASETPAGMIDPPTRLILSCYLEVLGCSLNFKLCINAESLIIPSDWVYDPVIRPITITQDNRLGLDNQDGDCATVSFSLMAWNQYHIPCY